MSRKAVLLLGLALSGAALAATLMGCGGPVPPSADRPAASHATVAGLASEGTRAPAPAASPARTRAVAPGRATSSPSTPAQRPAAPSSAPTPDVPSPHRTSAALADGIYTDAPDGVPHYVLAVSLGKGGVITGSVNFLYTGGQIGIVGSYRGDVAGDGKLSIVFADGKDLAGSYARGTLTLVGCRSVLARASSAGCTFTYHGHVP